MFQLVGIPEKISNYIQHCYRNMTAYIQSQEWITSSFPITQGVFQGDTQSPVIFCWLTTEAVDSHCNTHVVPQNWLTFPPPSGDLPERTAVPSFYQTNHLRLNPRMPSQTKAPSISKELSTSAKALLTTSPSSTQMRQNTKTLSKVLKALQETLDFPSIQLNVSP